MDTVDRMLWTRYIGCYGHGILDVMDTVYWMSWTRYIGCHGHGILGGSNVGLINSYNKENNLQDANATARSLRGESKIGRKDHTHLAR